jgi:hypothetical protein
LFFFLLFCTLLFSIMLSLVVLAVCVFYYIIWLYYQKPYGCYLCSFAHQQKKTILLCISKTTKFHFASQQFIKSTFFFSLQESYLITPVELVVMSQTHQQYHRAANDCVQIKISPPIWTIPPTECVHPNQFQQSSIATYQSLSKPEMIFAFHSPQCWTTSFCAPK